jgi:hypothetical protein
VPRPHDAKARRLERAAERGWAEVEEMALAIKEMMKASDSPQAKALMERPLCTIDTSSLGADGAPPASVTVTEGREGDRITCDYTVTIARFDPSENPNGQSGILTMRQADPAKQETMTLDLTKAAVFMPMLDALLGIGVQQKMQEQGQSAAGDPIAVGLATRRMMGAMLKWAVKRQTVQVELTGAKVIDTNGAVSPDGKSVTFKFAMGDLVDQATGSPNGKAQVYRATVAY